MLKLGYDIRHEDISGITLECLCRPWYEHVDDASTIQDVDLYSGGGEILFHWHKVFQARHRVRLGSSSQATHVRQSRWTGLVFVLKELVQINMAYLGGNGEERTVVLQGRHL